jgi:integrase/recombinase XerD
MRSRARLFLYSVSVRLYSVISGLYSVVFGLHTEYQLPRIPAPFADLRQIASGIRSIHNTKRPLFLFQLQRPPMSLEYAEATLLYLEHKFLRKDSELTIEREEYALGRFGQFLAQRGVLDVHAVSPEDLSTYSAELEAHRKEDGTALSAATRFAYLISVRGLFRFLAKRGYLFKNPAAKLILPRVSGSSRRPFSETEVEQMLASVHTDSAIGIRDRAVLEVLYSAGLRRRELAGLLLSDVQDETLFVRLGKNQRQRMVPCGVRAMDWIQKYTADARPDLIQDKAHDVLFVNRKGLPISPESVSEIVREYKASAGLEKAGAAHLMRHTSATLMLENGADIRHVQEFLGHENIESTKIYTHVLIDHLRKDHERFHPASSLSAELKSPGKNRTRIFRSSAPAAGERRQPSFPGAFAHIATEYLDACRTSGLAPATLYNRARFLAPFFQWLSHQGISDVVYLSSDVLLEYQKFVSQRQKKTGGSISARQIYSYLVHVFLFSRWLFESGRLLHDPALPLDLPKKPSSLPRAVLSMREVSRIFSRPDTETPVGLRDRALLEVMFSCALRRSDAADVKLCDYDTENQTLHIHSRKTDSARILPVGDRAADWLEKYILIRSEFLLPGSTEETLFLSSSGRKFSLETISEIVRKYMHMAGVHKPDAGHILRRTCATLLLENGAGIRTVQEILGHRELRTTQLYTKVSIKKLREVHRRTHPAEIQAQRSRMISGQTQSQKRVLA